MKDPKSINRRPDRDRRANQAARIARILTVLKLIQSKGTWNAKSIASELEITERTIYRDLETLKFAGVPWYYDQEAESYRVRDDYRFVVPNLTEDEIVGQVLATAITKSAGLDIGGGAGPTTQKIAAVADERTKEVLADTERIVSVLGLQLADHSGHHHVIRAIRQGLIQQRVILASYKSPYQTDPVELKLHPIRMCLVKNAWYLIAQEADFPKSYRIARFFDVSVLDQRATVPDEFDLKAYFGNAWAVFRGEEQHRIRIRFLGVAARIVPETQWHATQQVEQNADGSVVLSFVVDGLEEITEWVLAWTGQAQVLEPQELRETVVKRLLAGLELNR